MFKQSLNKFSGRASHRFKTSLGDVLAVSGGVLGLSWFCFGSRRSLRILLGVVWKCLGGWGVVAAEESLESRTSGFAASTGTSISTSTSTGVGASIGTSTSTGASTSTSTSTRLSTSIKAKC